MNILTLLAFSILLLSGVNTEHFPPWTSFHAEVSAFAASVLLLLAWGQRGPMMVPASWCLLLVLAGSAWLQWAAGHLLFVGDAVVLTVYLMAFGIAWLWGYQADKLGRGHEALHWVCGLLVVAGLLAVLQTTAQWLRVEEAFCGWIFSAGKNVRSTGNFGQPNQTATLLLMAVAATGVLMVRGKFGRLVGWPLLILLGWAVVLTQSRTGLLSAGSMVALFIAVNHMYPGLKAYRKDALSWLAFVLLASWGLHQQIVDVGKAGMGLQQMAQAGTRQLLWQQLASGLLQSPWTGYGWLQVGLAQQVGALQIPGVEQVNYAHNAIFDLYLALGIPAASLVLGVALHWLVVRLRRLGTEHGVAVSGLFILLPFLVHTQLELPHAYAYFLLPVGILLGVLDASTQGPGVRAWRFPRWGLLSLVIVWVSLLAVLAYEYALAEEDFRVNRFENRRLGETPPDYEPPELRLLTQLGDMLKAMRLRAAPDMKPEDIELLVRTSRRYTWAAMHYRTALALGLNNRPDEATAHLRTIKMMFSPEIYEEGRASWQQMQKEKYPQLGAVELP